MIYKRIAILLISALVIMPMTIIADESGPIVAVEKKNNEYSVFAEGYGSGTTLEFAKFAAINSVLPQLINETNDMPGSIKSLYGVNDELSGQGTERIFGQTMIEGYWELENGVYRYLIKIMIKNDNVKKTKE